MSAGFERSYAVVADTIVSGLAVASIPSTSVVPVPSGLSKCRIEVRSSVSGVSSGAIAS